tara:strand:+ start:3471 stop:4631 length:1161 start_codon:yes stop_codon:yes gene_type:complete
MKKKIAILGSTGSIGKSLLKIISNDKKNFKVELLSARKNYKILLDQAIKFNVKKIIITDKKFYDIAKSKNKRKIKIFNNFNNFNKILPKKIDYVMSSIVGLEGLYPTIKIIKFTKKIAIANKESIICAWNLIKNELNKHKTEFVPVDSEHFSIWYALNNNLNTKLSEVHLTASGGSLLNIPKKKFDNLGKNQILKHPNWKMGRKITIDSSTLMNKVFEIIEAKKIFNLNYNQLNIIIHPKSYIHAILKFSNGMIKIIAHDTTMEIPIFNSIYLNTNKSIKTKKIDFNKLNYLNLKKVDAGKFPIVKILKILPDNNSLYETALVAANDELVKHYLDNKIKFNDITSKIIKIMHTKELKKLKKILPRKITDVINVNNYVRMKINSRYV